MIQKGPVYGEVEEFLTFETDTFGEKAAFVFAGKQEKGCFSGSIWLVKEKENVVYLGGGEWKVEDACYYLEALEEKIIYDIVLPIEIVKEIEEIQYDSMLVQECKTTEGIVIPVVVKAVSMQGEEILITMDASYQISEDRKEGRFFVENVEVIG